MRQFGTDYLFKVSLEADSVYSKFYLKKVKPIYVVQPNKKEAQSYAEKIIQDGLRVKSISLIAEQYAGSLFGQPHNK